MTTVSTMHLPVGELVYTTAPVGSDFGLPIVKPALGVRGRHIRQVRNAVKCQGGHVVWFTDGTKTPPLHGRAVFMIAAPFLGDPREEES